MMLVTRKIAGNDLDVRTVEIHGYCEGAPGSTLAKRAMTHEGRRRLTADAIADFAANATALVYDDRVFHGPS